MSRSQAIFKNTTIQMAGRAVGLILGVVTLGIMTRALGVASFGSYTTAFSFLQLFGFLVDFGLTLTTVAMISEDEEDAPRVLGAIVAIRTMGAAIFLGLAPILALAFPYPPEVRIGIGVGALAFFALAVSQIYTGIFQWKLRMGYSVAAEVVGKVVILGATALAAWHGWGVPGMMVALGLGNVVAFLILKTAAQRLVAVRLNLNRALARKILSRSWPIGISIAFNLIYLRADVLVLAHYRSASEVGLYGAAYKAIDVIQVFPFLIMGLILPFMVRAIRNHDLHDFRRITDRTFSVFALAIIPLVAAMAVLGRPFMQLVAGSDFAQSGPLLAVLVVAASSVFFGALFGHAIIALDLQRRMVWAYAADAVLSLVLYFIFIPRFGAWGAAGVTIFSELFIALINFVVVSRKTAFIPSLASAGKALAAAILMATALFFTAAWPVLARIALGAAVYGVGIVLFRAVDRATLRMLIHRT